MWPRLLLCTIGGESATPSDEKWVVFWLRYCVEWMSLVSTCFQMEKYGFKAVFQAVFLWYASSMSISIAHIVCSISISVIHKFDIYFNYAHCMFYIYFYCTHCMFYFYDSQVLYPFLWYTNSISISMIQMFYMFLLCIVCSMSISIIHIVLSVYFYYVLCLFL